jgi:ATP-dependent Zn protease
MEDRSSVLIYSPEIASRVDARLEAAYARARGLIRQHRAAIEELARSLMDHDTLEGPELGVVLTHLDKLVAMAAEGAEAEAGHRGTQTA